MYFQEKTNFTLWKFGWIFPIYNMWCLHFLLLVTQYSLLTLNASLLCTVNCVSNNASFSHWLSEISHRWSRLRLLIWDLKVRNSVGIVLNGSVIPKAHSRLFVVAASSKSVGDFWLVKVSNFSHKQYQTTARFAIEAWLRVDR